MFKPKPAVFLDRDGVLNRQIFDDKGLRRTPLNPDEVEILPGVVEGLHRLKAVGYKLIVVTNQPDVAKGKVTSEMLERIKERFYELLGSATLLDGYYACLHHPDADQVKVAELLRDCGCRKPKPGLIHQAVIKQDIDLDSSWLIGDYPTDIAAGLESGIEPNRLILIGSDKTTLASKAANLTEAVEMILRRGKVVTE